MTLPNFIVIGLQIGKLHGGGGRNRPPRPYQILKSPTSLGLITHNDKANIQQLSLCVGLTGNLLVFNVNYFQFHRTEHNSHLIQLDSAVL